RGLYKTLTKANGLAGRDVLMWVDGTEFFYNGVKKGDVWDSRKDFYFIGPYIVIWPDKAFYNVKLDSFGRLEERYLGGVGQISFCNGTYAEAAAIANCIVTSGTAFAFDVGDAVTISGCSDAKNNICAIVREISDDKKTLRFYENTFHIASGTSYSEAGTVTIERKLPDMDFLCENENRLWGCRGDEIFCSSLGNPKVWMDYDGLATCSWSGAVGSAGDFVACASFLGYAIFFKEDCIHKVYGSKPSDFQIQDGGSAGVKSGCNGSFAIAGETLFYRSRAGIVRYNGGFPYQIDKELGTLSPLNAVAGTDGRKYFVSGVDSAGRGVFLCYDTQNKLWLREDDAKATAFAFAEGLYFLAGNEIWKIEAESGTAATNVSSFAEFGDFYEGSPNRKTVSAIQIRADVHDGAVLRALIRFDNDTQWQDLGTLSGDKEMHKLSIVPRRCDYWRLRLEGLGEFKVYAIAREFAAGTDSH
ncbi:MAG: hypothetical protein RR235_08530, partial [Oscillospiraceae bacterium]